LGFEATTDIIDNYIKLEEVKWHAKAIK
jgi:hypothetical protein